ncbi:hypothetical protein HA397_29080, partial [Escherichia coli]|nr:hypothetical protein [Escherichia coli]
AIRSEGIGYGDTKVKAGDDVERHDNGRTGDGFFFAGRLVEAAHNIAANTNNGYVWMTRRSPEMPDADNMDFSEVAYGRERMSVDKAPIQGFHDNEAFGTHTGLIVIKAGPLQKHDIRTVMTDFLNWETSNGAHLTYTSHYTLKNFDLIGTYNTDRVASTDTGFDFGHLTFDLTVNGLTIDNFKVG